MKDDSNFNTSKSVKSKKNKPEVKQEIFTKHSRELIRNRKERDYSGNYCKNTFKKHRDLKLKLNKEEKEEFIEELYIENPREAEKTFVNIEIFDVIGCIKYSRPCHPKSYLVISKDKEEQILEVIPWQHSWLETPSDKIKHSIREFQHQFKSVNVENKISIEDLGLTISLGLYTKLYKFNKTLDKFSIPDSDIRKVKIVSVIKQETPENTV